MVAEWVRMLGIDVFSYFRTTRNADGYCVDRV
jgi:hypothetical protein